MFTFWPNLGIFTFIMWNVFANVENISRKRALWAANSYLKMPKVNKLPSVNCGKSCHNSHFHIPEIRFEMRGLAHVSPAHRIKV